MLPEDQQAAPAPEADLDDPYAAAFVARIYDGEPAQPNDDVAWSLRLAASRAGPVADLGCGTGRLTLPLARAGHTVVAVDRSAAMLETLQHTLGREPAAVRQRVVIARGDLRDWRLPAAQPKVALALLGYNTFGALLTPEHQAQFLRATAANLAPGGLLALATAAIHARLVLLPEGLTQQVYRRAAPELGAGVEVARRDMHRWTDETRQLRRLAVIYDTFAPDGGRQQRQFEYAVRYSSRWELEHLLARHGFAECQVAGGYDDEPFTVEGGLLVLTARHSPDAACR